MKYGCQSDPFLGFGMRIQLTERHQKSFYMMINDENMEIGKSFLKGSFPV
jgi:hypothetical protein